MMEEICSRFLPLIYSDKSKILKETFTLGDWIKLLKDKGHSFAWDSPTEDGQGNLQIMVMGWWALLIQWATQLLGWPHCIITLNAFRSHNIKIIVLKLNKKKTS